MRALVQLADDRFGKLAGLAGSGKGNAIHFGGDLLFRAGKGTHPGFQRVAAPKAEINLGRMARQLGRVGGFFNKLAVDIPGDAVLFPNESIVVEVFIRAARHIDQLG